MRDALSPADSGVGAFASEAGVDPGSAPAAGGDVLVLSGGGARGAAQVGMLAALFEAGVAPAAFVGTSVGALNATAASVDCTAAGAASLREQWLRVESHTMFAPVCPDGSRRARAGEVVRSRSVFSNAHLAEMIEAWVPVSRLEDLPVPVRVVTTSLPGRRAVYHDRGDVRDLLLASAALPGLFSPIALPHPRTGKVSLHVDGGFSDVVPLSGAASLAPDRVFVLDVTPGPLPASLGASLSEAAVLDASVEADLTSADGESQPGPDSPVAAGRRGAAAVASDLWQTMRVRGFNVFDSRVEVVWIRARTAGFKITDFSRTEELIEAGASAARDALARPPVVWDPDAAAPSGLDRVRHLTQLPRLGAARARPADAVSG